jgi:DNA (cytosine-5)-methyltransferase 1
VILEHFAGPGGWDTGARLAGIEEDILGVEIVRATCDTAIAAGHQRLFADVREMRGARLPRVSAHISSPPCQTFSQAGKGTGRKHLASLAVALEKVAASGTLPEDAVAEVGDDVLDERSLLVLEPMLTIREHTPEWIAMEQVPAVLPIWEAYAIRLQAMGYYTWTGHLHAETYGVPQTRKRAFLLARTSGPIAPPMPTHMRYNPRDPDPAPDLFLDRWVTMGDALSLAEETLVGFPRRADGLGEITTINGVDYRARDLRTAEEPSLTVTQKARSWKIWEPVYHDQSGTAYDPEWPFKRPATVVAGRGLIQNPGATANRYNGSTKSRNDGVQVSVAQAGVLQSFPVDYPWQGSRTHQFQQAGDAVPPLMAAAVLRAVTS